MSVTIMTKLPTQIYWTIKVIKMMNFIMTFVGYFIHVKRCVFNTKQRATSRIFCLKIAILSQF